MSARTYRDKESGLFRAVCRSEECRDSNAQRNYWRTGHLSEAAAIKAARTHNRAEHGGDR